MSQVQPPKALQIPETIVQHGHERVDEYSWLRDKNWQKFIAGDLDFSDSRVREYLDAENAYTESVMASTNELQEALYKEIVSRIKEDDQTAPMKFGEYYYYQRTETGKNYPILCRKKGLEASEEVLFDVNKEAEGCSYFRLGWYEFSEDNRLMLYTFNNTGSMEFKTRVRDLDAGKDYPWTLDQVQGMAVWAESQQTVYYVERHPENSRGYKLWRFKLADGPEAKELVFEKPAELSEMFMGIHKTTSQRFVVMEIGDHSSNLQYLLDLQSDSPEPVLVAPIQQDVKYEVEHRKDTLYMLTNKDGATNRKILTSHLSNLGKDQWQEWVEHRPDVYIEGIAIYSDYLIQWTTNNQQALPSLLTRNLDSGEVQEVSMQDEAYSISFLGAMEPDAKTVQYVYQSPVQPPQTLELNLETGQQQVVKPPQTPNYDPSLYETKREFAKGHDGAEIPVTITYKKGLQLDGSAPAYVFGYGSYGMALPAFFGVSAVSLLDRGFVVAYAHVRGGADKGYDWYLDGKLKKKKNSFYDFISSCEHLIERGYTQKGEIVANGGSAGGLLMGGVINMRPDLFKAVILDVAFVDLINTISDEGLPLTPPEWNEWGNPIKSKEDYEYMMSYSPYDNVKAQNYPHLLFNSGITDEQVTYWEPTKMVARLRERKTDDNTLLLRMRMGAGHAGASARYERYREKAFDFAFALGAFEGF